MSKNKTPLTVVVSTRKYDQKYYDHIKKMFSHDKTEILIYENNNEKSLSVLYNEALEVAKNEIVVFIHDDLIIETTNVTSKIHKLFDTHLEYGIIGVAGTDNLTSGMWWEQKENMQGQVKHQNDEKTWRNEYSKTFGDSLKEVVIIDGLFMVIHKGRIKHNFDEDFSGFHFYDLPICVNNHKDNIKIGVTTKIKLIHKSIGQTNNKWVKGKYQFESKYGDLLPLTI